MTAVVVTVKVADFWPDGMVIELGTVAALLLLESVRATPEEPAGPFNVTVPVEGDPPWTDVGFKVTERTLGGVMVSVAL